MPVKEFPHDRRDLGQLDGFLLAEHSLDWRRRQRHACHFADERLRQTAVMAEHGNVAFHPVDAASIHLCNIQCGVQQRLECLLERRTPADRKDGIEQSLVQGGRIQLHKCPISLIGLFRPRFPGHVTPLRMELHVRLAVSSRRCGPQTHMNIGGIKWIVYTYLYVICGFSSMRASISGRCSPESCRAFNRWLILSRSIQYNLRAGHSDPGSNSVAAWLGNRGRR